MLNLGEPIPAHSEHAVSVSMPTWQDVIDYEEGVDRVKKALKTGYPRFVFHPYVQKLIAYCEKQFANPGEQCLIFPSLKVAQSAVEFIQSQSDLPVSVFGLGFADVHAISFAAEASPLAKAYWQHSGEIVSSRLAKAILQNLESHNVFTEHDVNEDIKTKNQIKQRIADLTGEDKDNVYLFPCGMAAIYAAYKLTQQLFSQKKTVQFGFPYVDTAKIQEKFGQGFHFLPKADQADLESLKKLLIGEQIAGLFTEFPTNPLLSSVDLTSLKELSQRYKFPIVIDDTVGTFANVSLFPTANILVTSLTKFFTGEGDVAAGSLVLSSQSPFYKQFKQILAETYEDLLWHEDAALLERHSRQFEERMQVINKNAEALCDFLSKHPKVNKIYYPKYQQPELYTKYQRPGAGFGGLFSVLLKDAAQNAPIFYDELKVFKGPSLGTNYTLACPYTLLAHYQELQFVDECGVSPFLVRVSVGLENINDLIACFDEALNKL
jgi:cystathionine gamma-synthase